MKARLDKVLASPRHVAEPNRVIKCNDGHCMSLHIKGGEETCAFSNEKVWIPELKTQQSINLFKLCCKN